MRIYVASKFENKDEVRRAMKLLQDEGYSITHDWTGEDFKDRTGTDLVNYARFCAWKDRRGVENADALLLINHPACKGTLVEMGIAIANNKPIVIVGRDVAENIFFNLSNCLHVKTVEEALPVLRGIHAGIVSANYDIYDSGFDDDLDGKKEA